MLYTNGTPQPTSADEEAPRRRRLARRLMRDLIAFTGVTAAEATTPKAARRQSSSRITYRKNLSDADVDALLAQVGAGRWWSAFERYTRPKPQQSACEGEDADRIDEYVLSCDPGGRDD